jgi:hypothetical protein
LRKFSLYLFLLTVIITITGWVLFQTYLPEKYFTGFLLIPFLFFSITLAFHYYLIKSSHKEIIKFTPRFIGATGIKMMIYFILIVVYLLIDRHQAVSFLVCFLICYFFYTAFEIISVLKYLKRKE